MEEVNVHYPVRSDERHESPGSSATTIISVSSERTGNAKYVRAWVHNVFGFPAHSCQVFVERILHDETVVESERSPLHWTDIDGAFEFPVIPRGYRSGHYVDICATDSVDKSFQVISQKWTKGYHRFRKSGKYRLEIKSEAMKPCFFGSLTITLDYDATDWKNLRVVSAKEGKRFCALW